MLLLDEPTNNLDIEARHKLADVLEQWTGCLLLVSHDRALLDRMDRIAELDRGDLRFYGGNFTAYEAAVRAAQEVAEKNVRNAEQELKREKRELQEARERAARRASNASRNLKNAGLPKIFAGTLKRNAQESAGRADELHSARVSEAKARLDEAGQALRNEQKLSVELPGTQVPAGRTLLAAERMQVRYGGRPVFAGDGVDLTIRGPERIALLGANGAGKSTLLRLVTGALEPGGGRVRRADGRIAYLSQRLDLLDPERTVAENLAVFAPQARRRGGCTCSPVSCFGVPERSCRSGCSPVASGCGPLWPVSWARSRHRSSCCSTSRPTTSTWSASVSWRARSTPTRVRWWWSATTSGSSRRSRSAAGCGSPRDVCWRPVLHPPTDGGHDGG